MKTFSYMKYSIYIIFILICHSAFGQRLSVEQQKADFDTLCAILEYVHPNLYIYQSVKEYDSNKAKIIRGQ